jgi:hypothetical protein
MDEKPPFVIAYGSLMSKDSIRDYFGSESLKSAETVEINGYKRVFNTRITVRQGSNRAILNTQRNDDYNMNAVKIKCNEFENFGRYAVREDGYRFTMVGDCIRGEFDTDRKFLMPTNRSISDSNILPHSEYLDTCINSSKDWGLDFHKKFLDTTYLMDDRKLEDYLDDSSV